MSDLRGAVIGCGRMGAFTSELMLKWAPKCWHPLSHCEALDSASNVKLVAVCDLDVQRIERVLALYPEVGGFTCYDELLSKMCPDILCVATRAPGRAIIVERAAMCGVRGLHLEKPLCNSMTELESIEIIFDSTDLVCTYGTLRRYMPTFQRARELVQSGCLGPLNEIQVCFGSQPLMWTHPHSFDLLSFFADDTDVVKISACLIDEGIERNGAYLEGDPIVKSVTIEFSSGVTGLITQSGGNDVVLTCRDGSVTVESGGRRIRLRESLGEGDPYWDALTTDYFTGESGGTRLAIERLAKGLRDSSLKHISLDKDAIIIGQKLLFASVQSYLEGGRAVSPSDIDPMLCISGRSPDGRYA